MKAPSFAYHRPACMGEALELLENHGDEALPLAGGQSLMPMLNLRVSRPAALVDLNRLDELVGVRAEGGGLRIGAMTRYVDLERSERAAELAPLLMRALPHVAHVAVRNRGTVGGSVALADPAAEIPACVLALGADLVLASTRGTRTVSASEFIVGAMETARRPDELLVEILVPAARAVERSFFHEMSRRHGDFALAGVAGTLRTIDGRVEEPVIVVFGCADRPVIAKRAAAALAGERWDAKTRRAVRNELTHDISPIDFPQARGAYRLELARVALARALDEALRGDRSGGAAGG